MYLKIHVVPFYNQIFFKKKMVDIKKLILPASSRCWNKLMDLCKSSCTCPGRSPKKINERKKPS